MSDGNDEGCIEFPEIPEIPAIKLPAGAELQGFMNFAEGLPNDCTVMFNLMAQLPPFLASFGCVLKILEVLTKLTDFVDAAKSLDVVGMGEAASELQPAITDLASCIPQLAIPRFMLTVKGILELIIKFLSCLLDELDSIINFQVSIDLSIAEGNPELLEVLLCAQENGNKMTENLMASMAPVQPLIDMVGSLAGLVPGLEGLKLPSMADFTVSEDMSETVGNLRDTVDALKQVVETIPG